MSDHTSLKTPPLFGADESKDYSTWKNELSIWRRMTTLEVKKKALAIVLSLSGRARQIALQIPVEQLDNENEVDTLSAKLDDSFKREEVDCAYEAYANFEKFSRRNDLSMSSYILEFEQLHEKAKSYKMALPDTILAFKLLENSNIDEKEADGTFSLPGSEF